MSVNPNFSYQDQHNHDAQNHCYVDSVKLTNFRNYTSLRLDCGPSNVILVGDNGAGKTNLLEAISLFSPGRGLRRAVLNDLANASYNNWSVFANLCGQNGEAAIGTGILTSASDSSRLRRDIRVDGNSLPNTQYLSDYIRILWLTPAMDGLFTGPSSDRRRFLDRMVSAIYPQHSKYSNSYESALKQRNAVLASPSPDRSWLSALETQIAEYGSTIAASRVEMLALLQGVIDQRKNSEFPVAHLTIEGELEKRLLSGTTATDVELEFSQQLAETRMEDKMSGRTRIGPHRSDLIVIHDAKSQNARLCSTGEQKILLCGLFLAHAHLVKEMNSGFSPILLLDEITAHLDSRHRHALFQEIQTLGGQAWLTGTDKALFENNNFQSIYYKVCDGKVDVFSEVS